jgi:hypothetical protein
MKVNNNENITEFKGNENKTKLNNVRDKKKVCSLVYKGMEEFIL